MSQSQESGPKSRWGLDRLGAGNKLEEEHATWA